jgi:hypothetical protein
LLAPAQLQALGVAVVIYPRLLTAWVVYLIAADNSCGLQTG